MQVRLIQGRKVSTVHNVMFLTPLALVGEGAAVWGRSTAGIGQLNIVSSFYNTHDKTVISWKHILLPEECVRKFHTWTTSRSYALSAPHL
jgi:hypothetical protein